MSRVRKHLKYGDWRVRWLGTDNRLAQSTVGAGRAPAMAPSASGRIAPIPDDTHHFMRHANQRRVHEAAAAYLQRKLMTRVP